MNQAIKKTFLLTTLALIGMINTPLFAKPIDNTAKIWNNFTYLGYLSNDKKWLYDLEIEMDFKAKTNIYDSNTLTAVVGYALNKKISLWLGYDFIPTLNDGDNSADIEQRFYPQVVWKIGSTENAKFVSRSRLELRNDNQTSGSSYIFRQKIAISGKKKIFHTFTPALFDEIFFNVNKPNYTSNQLINENRFFLGGSVNLKKNVNLIIGYLNQAQFKESIIKMNHVFELVVVANA